MKKSAAAASAAGAHFHVIINGRLREKLHLGANTHDATWGRRGVKGGQVGNAADATGSRIMSTIILMMMICAKLTSDAR